MKIASKHAPHCMCGSGIHQKPCKDSRPTQMLGATVVRRRRYCTECLKNFTTYELRAADIEGLIDQLRDEAILEISQQTFSEVISKIGAKL